MKRLALVLVLVLVALPARAQKESRTQGAPQAWQTLSPERRERILENYRRYQGMDPARRRRLQERFKLFLRLPKEKRDGLIRRWQGFRSLSPDQRQSLRERWQGMGPAERRWRLKRDGGERLRPDRTAPRRSERSMRFERSEPPPRERHAPGHRR